MFDFFKFRTQKPETDIKTLTANEFVNVKDIRGNILYTKDRYIFAYIKITPVAIDLLSNEEKRASYKTLTASLSSETKPLKILAISRPVDIGSLTDDLYDTYLGATNNIQKKILAKEIEAINNFAMSGNMVERQFYISIWDKYADNSANDLQQRAYNLVRKFDESKITAAILDEAMIVQLCNLFANPNYAHLEDNNTLPLIPLIKRGENNL